VRQTAEWWGELAAEDPTTTQAVTSPAALLPPSPFYPASSPTRSPMPRS
jgi:hypothetical protein